MASKPKKDRFSESQQTILLKNQAKQQSPENMNKSQSALSLHQNNKNLPYIQRSQSRQISTKKYSDEQLEEMLQSMINGTKNEIEIDSIPDMKQYVNLKINHLVDNGELIEAQKYETINQQLVSFTASKHKYDLKSNRKKEYINQLKSALINLQEEQENMEIELSSYDENIYQIKKQQELDWNKQLADFDEITNGELPSNYKRFSQKLINLRDQTKSLIKSRHFEEAGLKKIEADELEKYELFQCRENYIQARQRQRERLIANHNQKMDCFEENYKRNRLKIIKDNQYIITCIEKTIINLQTKINDLQIDNFENTIFIKTPVSTPLQSAPLSPHQAKNKSSTFVTQQSSELMSNSLPKTTPNTSPMTPKSKTLQKPKQTSENKIMYRPIPSKWRFQTPQLVKSFKKKEI